MIERVQIVKDGKDVERVKVTRSPNTKHLEK